MTSEKKEKASIALELAEKQMRELERGIPSAAIIPLDAHRPSRSKWAKNDPFELQVDIKNLDTGVHMSEGRLIEPSRPNVRLGKGVRVEHPEAHLSLISIKSDGISLDAPADVLRHGNRLELDLRTNGLNPELHVRLIGKVTKVTTEGRQAQRDSVTIDFTDFNPETWASLRQAYTGFQQDVERIFNSMKE